MRLVAIALFGVWLVGCRANLSDSFEGNACISRLRMIDGAKLQWGLDHQKTTNDIPTWDDIRFYIGRGGAIPHCPAGGTYTVGRLEQPATCSYPGHKLP